MTRDLNYMMDIKDLQEPPDAIADAERFPNLPSGSSPELLREKRRQALAMLVRSCELWSEADRAGLRAVQAKMENVIMHAHDAFVQMNSFDRIVRGPVEEHDQEDLDQTEKC
jgi:hypothetical protein